jgi:hypothetical protein
MSDIQVVCATCGRVVSASPLRANATIDESTFFTVDDHEGPNGRCGAVGDVVTLKMRRTRRGGPS